MTMTVARAAALAIGAGLLGVWLVSAVPTTAPRPATGRPEHASAAGAPLFDFERQRQRLEANAVPAEAATPSARRNPFEFARRYTPDAARREPRGRRDDGAPSSDVLPDVPLPLALIGFAERRVGDAVERTAILSGLGEVFLAQVGERVAGRYTVEALGPDSADLIDQQSGERHRLPLR